MIFFEENACENIVCDMVAILSRPQCVKKVNLLFPAITSVALPVFQLSDSLRSMTSKNLYSQVNGSLKIMLKTVLV